MGNLAEPGGSGKLVRRYDRTAILDDGTRLEIKDLLCFAEDVRNMY